MQHHNYHKHEKFHFKNKKRIIKIGIALTIVGIVTYLIYYLGFIPLFVGVMEPPIGNAVEITEAYFEQNPGIAEMPNLDKINYAAYGTTESAEAVAESYKEELLNEGYSVKYEGTVEFEATSYDVTGYLKGLTATAVITTSDIGELYEEYESVVLYATGNALDFQEILDWYQNY